MAIRKSRALPAVMKVKAKRTSGGSKKRSLNALAIASRQAASAHKTPRASAKTQGGHLSASAAQKRKRETRQTPSQSEEEVEHGSDSDGNEWRLGEVASGEDSEIDSDYAFGESDEEKFEGFTFGASKSGKRTKLGKDPVSSATTHDSKNLNLEDSGRSDQDSWSGLKGDGPGDGAMDIAALLDGSEPNVRPTENRTAAATDESGDSDGSTSESESEHDIDSVLSVSDEEQERNDPAKLSALQDLIDSINPDSSERPAKRRRVFDGLESSVPSDFGITSTRKLTLDDLLPSITDPDMKRSLRLIASGKTSKDSGKRSGVPGKLEPPLAKRQQDRFDRAAAYAKSKETLERWIDTIKHNRRAEHLSFPLATPDSAGGQNSLNVLPRVETALPNELEATIQDILHQSGLRVRNGKTEEQNIQRMEELQSKRLSVEDVQARRAQLRMARELLFREEVRAKRIKKIKSKTYRRVHMKKREKADRDTKAALVAGGLVDSEEEQELNDKRRAEERMGARHRESRWARHVKATGLQKWDQDARSGIVEMANREEALKRKIEGKSKKHVDDGGDITSSEDDLSTKGSEDEDRAHGNERLLNRLNELDDQHSIESRDQVGVSRLSSMKFMQRANAARKLENDAAVQQLKRELAGEESTSASEEQPFESGRRTYQPKTGSTLKASPQAKDRRNDFEERLSDEDDVGKDDIDTGREGQPLIDSTGPMAKIQENGRIQGSTGKHTTTVKAGQNKKNMAVKKGFPAPATVRKNAVLTTNSSPKGASNDTTKTAEKKPPKQAGTSVPRESAPQSNSDKWNSVIIEDSEASSGAEELAAEGRELKVATLPQDELRLRAFAGDEVEESFKAEKEDAVRDEGDQVIDNTLPGWGHWIGDGVSKKEQSRHKGRFLTKVEGIKKEKRTDAKLENVIISEKRIKKNAKYLASTLPHPFENRQQYERSLRIPMGPEWTTKETFQDATKPRILLKQGIIAPMQNRFL